MTLYHQDNTFMKCLPPYTPLLFSKTGMCRGIKFLIQNRLWGGGGGGGGGRREISPWFSQEMRKISLMLLSNSSYLLLMPAMELPCSTILNATETQTLPYRS